MNFEIAKSNQEVRIPRFATIRGEAENGADSFTVNVNESAFKPYKLMFDKRVVCWKYFFCYLFWLLDRRIFRRRFVIYVI